MILLASASPRRAEILKLHGVEFVSESADIDEIPQSGELAQDYVLRLASEKAEDRLANLESRNCDLVLAADTCVAIEDSILGKPENYEHFSSMMQGLSGRAHEVHSGVALANRRRPIDLLVVTTRVYFRQITEAEILSFWQSGEPKDKAGGYGIQGLAAEFVERIEGSYSNVVGLPIFETMQLLHRWGVQSYLNRIPG